jgi:hypothetical protein
MMNPLGKVTVMEKNATHEVEWVSHLKEHCEQCDEISIALDQIQAEYCDGNDIKAELSELGDKIRALQAGTQSLYERMVVNPFRHMLSADRLNLTEEEYWLVLAAGFECFTAKSLGVSPISDYEAYRMCVYEDDKFVDFVHPDETPPPPTVWKGNTMVVYGRLALSPEEVDIAHFRQEQVEFFTKWRPDILPRLGQLKNNCREQSDGEAATSPEGHE